MHRVVGIRHAHAGDEYLHSSCGLQDVDAFEGVLGVHGDGGRFFEPFVHGIEIYFGETGEGTAGGGQVWFEDYAG